MKIYNTLPHPNLNSGALNPIKFAPLLVFSHGIISPINTNRFLFAIILQQYQIQRMRANFKNNREGVTFDFEEVGIVTHSQIVHNEEADMKHFLKEIETLNLPEIKNQPEIEKIKKRIEAFAKQYGEKTEKTTSIFMNYLETVRETGVNYLKNKDLYKASSYFAECLRFVDPKYDQIFYEKFLIVKIDAVNKLMYCLFELESQKNKEIDCEQLKQYKGNSRYENAERILTQFLDEIHEFQKIQSLKRSENCMLEVNYFYLGRLHRKNKTLQKGIEALKEALSLIDFKINSKFISKNEEIRNFLLNLKAKTYYKLSKCYRELKNEEQQRQFEQLALKCAFGNNNMKLVYYIHKKIKFYEGKQRFLERLSKLQGKRRIDEEITRLIDESRQTEVKSLYNVYSYQQLTSKLS